MDQKKIETIESTPKKINKQSFSYKKDKDAQLVNGIFRYYEQPGGTLAFWYRQYRGEHPGKYEMTDGERVRIPLGVARHLNNSGKYKVHQFTKDEKGNTAKNIGEIVSRYGFQSLEFMDLGDAEEPRIARITYV